jgi:hypothetical protein
MLDAGWHTQIPFKKRGVGVVQVLKSGWIFRVISTRSTAPAVERT